MTTFNEKSADLDAEKRKSDLSLMKFDRRFKIFREKKVDKYGEDRVQELEKEVLENAKY